MFIDNVTHLAFEKLTWMDRRDMGLLFETSILWPFLKMALIFAILDNAGELIVVKQCLNTVESPAAAEEPAIARLPAKKPSGPSADCKH